MRSTGSARPRATWKLRAAAVLLAASATVAVGCGGGQVVEGGEDQLLVGYPSLMGSDEQLVRDLLADMTAVLESNANDAPVAKDRMEAFLRVNGPAMHQAAMACAARLAALEPGMRRVYEAQYAAYMQDAFANWVRVDQQFRSRHSEIGREISDLIEAMDR